MTDLPDNVAALQQRLRVAREEYGKLASRVAQAECRAIRAENLIDRVRSIVNGDAMPGTPMGQVSPEVQQRENHLLGQIEELASDAASWTSHLMNTGKM